MGTIREEARELPLRERFDVVVAGGGVAGVAAAVAAARQGARVALLEKGYALGGLATVGNVIVYLPLCDGMGRQVIGGLSEELLKLSIRDGYQAVPECWAAGGSIEERQKRRYRVNFNPATFLLALEELTVSEGIDLYYDTHCCAVAATGGRIEALIVENKDGRTAIGCGAVVDATGDADICAQAGAPTVSLDTNVRAGWFYYQAGDQVKLCCLSDKFDPLGRTVYNTATGYRGDVAADVTRQLVDTRAMTRERLVKLAEEHPGVPVYPLLLPTFPGFRMTRRLAGGYVLEEADDGRTFADCIALTGDWRKAGPVFAIPLRCLTAPGFANLFAAGRCISADSAWDVTRAIPTCAATGEAAGIAATMAATGDIEVAALQAKLRAAGGILE